MERKRNRKRPEVGTSVGSGASHTHTLTVIVSLQAEVANNDVAKPEKVEYEIAKFLRSNLPLKQTTLLGHKVDYFIGMTVTLFESICSFNLSLYSFESNRSVDDFEMGSNRQTHR